VTKLVIRCPVKGEEDVCGMPVTLNISKAEPMTWNYPGAPAEFEVLDCWCGHREQIETKYKDEVWETIKDIEATAKAYAAEARYDAWRDDHPGRSYTGLPVRRANPEDW